MCLLLICVTDNDLCDDRMVDRLRHVTILSLCSVIHGIIKSKNVNIFFLFFVLIVHVEGGRLGENL